MAQLSFTEQPNQGFPGTADSAAPHTPNTFANDAASGPGRLIVRRNNTVDTVPVGGHPVADVVAVDSILVTGASAAAPQVLTAVDFDGTIIGSSFLGVPDQISFVFDSNTDWDATNATLTGILGDGSTGSETIAIPNDGNATVNSVGAFWQVTQIDIPTQTGVGGTFTVGHTGALRTLTSAQILGVLTTDETRAGGVDFPTPVPSAQSGQRTNDTVMAQHPGFWVETELALVNASPTVFVRVVATAPEELGVFRSTADGTDTVALTGTRVVRSASATLASLAFDFRT